MQQTIFAFDNKNLPTPPLNADQQQRLIELMAQAIEAVLQQNQVGGDHDRS